MEKKIQVSTVKMTADVEVINVSSYLVANVVRTFDTVDRLVKDGKQEAEEFDKTEQKWKTKFDENGNVVYNYANTTIPVIEECVRPFLKELLEAFGLKPLQ